MKQAQFEQRHEAQWQRFAVTLEALERGKRKGVSADEFASEYRRVCQHLAMARERGYGSHLVDPLHALAMRGHQQLYRHRGRFMANAIAFLLVGFPRQVREQWRFVLLASVLFLGGSLLMGTLVYAVPDLVYSVVDPAQVSEMESMYAPDARRFGQAYERGASEDWMMFGYYVMNNIGIAFQTFASGLLFGIGSLFYLLFNGLLIGAIAGHLTDIGYGRTFWSFVVGHGAFELTALVLAGAAGLKLGWALLSPGRLRRSEALRAAAGQSIQLVAGVTLFLLIAAFIEAYWSSMTWPAPAVKYAVGAGLWLLVLGYLGFAGRGRHAPD